MQRAVRVWVCCLVIIAAHAAPPPSPRRMAKASEVSFSSNPEHKFIVTIFVDNNLRCPGVALSTVHVLAAASCFETAQTVEDNIWAGELQDHHEQNLGTSGWRVVVVAEMAAHNYGDFDTIPSSAKRPAVDITVHPNYDQTCSTDYDVAVLTLSQAEAFGSGQQLAQLHDAGVEIGVILAAGWGHTHTTDRSVAPEGTLRLSSVNVTSGSECSDHWPEWNGDWQLCTTPYAGSGPCLYDNGAVLFWQTSGSTPTVAGLLSRLGSGSCPKAEASWARVSALKDFICGVTGCVYNPDTDSQGSKGLCRWTAIEVHTILTLILCGFLMPLALGTQLVTYELARKPDNTVDLLYLQDDYPKTDKAVLILDTVGAAGFLLPAVVVVAVGVAPSNANSFHSVLGYVLLVLIAVQAVLTLILRQFGTSKKWTDKASPKFLFYRFSHFNTFAIYVLVLYVETPLGIMKIGYGMGAFIGWFAYIAFLHLLHIVWVQAATCARPRSKVAPQDDDELSKLEELEDHHGVVRRASQRSKSVSPSRRTSLHDHHKPYFVTDRHIEQEERTQKRRETVAHEARRSASTNVFEQLAASVKRRKSISEGVADFFSQGKSELESERRTSRWEGIRRASIHQAASGYLGPADTGVNTVEEQTKELNERRSSTRRGSVRDMNG